MLSLPLLLLLAAPPQAAEGAPSLLPPREAPLTVAEASGFRRSSRLDEVLAFVDALADLPHGDRLTVRTIGRTTEGRPLVAVTAALPPGEAPRSRVLVNANIHGGEIEGKAACQLLLRDIALGRHTDLLEAFELTLVPVYNADGNDRIARTERVSQNGPDGGVGARPNAMGLDLNRDFVKCEAPETRALLALANELDPLAFFDLHTTNGSPHGYDLTYAPSLCPNARQDLVDATRALLADVSRVLEERDGVFTFDYGNFRFAPRERGSRGERGDPVAWDTYDPRPRFGTNLMGLRGCVSILSEAYSYLPYGRRVEVTYAFTLECLHQLAARRVELEALRAAPSGEGLFGLGPALGPAERLAVRVGDWETVTVDLDPRSPGVQAGTRRVASPRAEARPVAMDVLRRFTCETRVEMGAAWAISRPDPRVLALLELHLGAAPPRLDAPLEVEVHAFVVEAVDRERQPFQGHRAVSLRGRFEARTLRLPAGAVIVPSSALTAQLLHPLSSDSFTTWNLFDADLPGDGDTAAGAGATHPCLRIDGLPAGFRFR